MLNSEIFNILSVDCNDQFGPYNFLRINQDRICL